MSVALNREGNVSEFLEMLFSNYTLRATSVGSSKVLCRENARIPWVEKWKEDDSQCESYKHPEILIAPTTTTGQGQGQGSGAPLPSASVCHQASNRTPLCMASSPQGTLSSHMAPGCDQLCQDGGLAHGLRLSHLKQKTQQGSAGGCGCSWGVLPAQDISTCLLVLFYKHLHSARPGSKHLTYTNSFNLPENTISKVGAGIFPI